MIGIEVSGEGDQVVALPDGMREALQEEGNKIMRKKLLEEANKIRVEYRGESDG